LPEFFIIAHILKGELGRQIDWLDTTQQYSLVKSFKRQLRFGPFLWNRPENPFGMMEDDIWMSSLYVYQKKRQ